MIPHQKKILFISLILQNSIIFIIDSTPSWSASKSRRSDTSLQLSQKKLIDRYEELEVRKKFKSSPEPKIDIPQESNIKGLTTPSSRQTPSSYDEYVVDMRKRLTQKKSLTDESKLNQEIQDFYMTPPKKIYSDSAQFIAQHVKCSDEFLQEELNGPLKKRNELTSLLHAVNQLSSTQQSLKEEMGTHSIKNGTKELQKLQDTNRIGNIPHPKFYVKRDQGPLTILRMGTQTRDIPKTEASSAQRRAEVAPEFAAFIQGLSLPGRDQQHVYVNLQMTVNRGAGLGLFGGGFGDFKKERPRAEALHAFSQSRGNELIVISLDKNSHFYQYFPPTGPSQEVIQRLADRFFPSSDDIEKHWLRTGVNLSDLWSKDTGHCPKSADGFPNQKECKALLKQKFTQEMKKISDDFFGKQANLNRDQSKTFIDLAYQYIINLSTQRATSMNMSCKSGVDRAGGVNAHFYLTSLIKEICSGTEPRIDVINQKIEELKYVFFEDAVLYNGRPVNDDRLKRFQATARSIIQGALHQVQNQKTCMSKSGDLLFSGESLSHAMSTDGQKPLGCISPSHYSTCSSSTSTLEVSAPAHQLENDLHRLGTHSIQSHTSNRRGNPPWTPPFEQEYEEEED